MRKINLPQLFVLAVMGTVLSIVGLNLANYEVPYLLMGALALEIFGGLAFFAYLNNSVIYCLKRVAEAVVTLFVIATLTFILLRIMPGGPFDAEKVLPPEIKANIEKKYGLDKPAIVQYMSYLKGVATLEFGESYKYIGRSVGDIIAESFPASFVLGIYSFALSFIIGIPLGLFAASKHNTWWDSITMGVAISGVALPNFLVGSVLIIVFSYYLGVLPPAMWDSPLHYILPVVTLGIRPAAFIARLTRSTVLDVIRADYIRTARSKGLSQFTVLYKHVLKNSLIPVLTYSGPLLAGILSGSFVIEVLFAVPGIGKHLVQSVTNRDYPLILGLTLLYSVLLVLSNLIVDLLYSFFDPRIRLA
ncbi:MAG: ABC transporter permease [Bdellovibrionales bacterium]